MFCYPCTWWNDKIVVAGGWAQVNKNSALSMIGYPCKQYKQTNLNISKSEDYEKYFLNSLGFVECFHLFFNTLIFSGIYKINDIKI